MPVSYDLAARQGLATPVADEPPARPIRQALLRGAAGRCPACGQGHLFQSYLKVAHTCGCCQEPLHHQRADDAPAYFTMAIVAHIVVGGLLVVEQTYAPPTWVQLSIWLPLMIVMSLGLLPIVKGMFVALQWALRMHGFGVGPDPAAPMPDPAAALVRNDRGPQA